MATLEGAVLAKVPDDLTVLFAIGNSDVFAQLIEVGTVAATRNKNPAQGR